MLLNKHVTITVKGINGNVTLVTVEKLCENSSLNVADKLVMEGLVKSCNAQKLHAEHQGMYVVNLKNCGHVGCLSDFSF